ncbi:hypothetical protein LXL04_008282 [Taraxacum kok-saghyz]
MDRISFRNSLMGRFPLGFLASLDFKEMILEREVLAKLVLRRSQASFAVEAEAITVTVFGGGSLSPVIKLSRPNPTRVDCTCRRHTEKFVVVSLMGKWFEASPEVGFLKGITGCLGDVRRTAHGSLNGKKIGDVLVAFWMQWIQNLQVRMIEIGPGDDGIWRWRWITVTEMTGFLRRRGTNLVAALAFSHLRYNSTQKEMQFQFHDSLESPTLIQSGLSGIDHIPTHV